MPENPAQLKKSPFATYHFHSHPAYIQFQQYIRYQVQQYIRYSNLHQNDCLEADGWQNFAIYRVHTRCCYLFVDVVLVFPNHQQVFCETQCFFFVIIVMSDRRSIKALCSVCGIRKPLRLDGNIQIHGPFLQHCLDSEKPPASTTPPSSPISSHCSAPLPLSSTYDIQQPSPPVTLQHLNQHLPSSTINPGPITGMILKRIPRASRPQCVF